MANEAKFLNSRLGAYCVSGLLLAALLFLSSQIYSLSLSPLDDPPLLKAAMEMDIGKVRERLSRGDSPGLKDESEWTALHYAAKNGDIPMIGLLAGAGADMDALSRDFKTPLHIAVLNGKLDSMAELIRLGARLDYTDCYGWTPLMLAAEEGAGKEAGILLEAGAKPDIQNRSGSTALDWAAAKGDDKIVSLLLARKADVEGMKAGRLKAPNRNFESEIGDVSTPLMDAALEGHPSTIRLLVAGGADIDAQGRYGRTALHMAAYKSRLEAVRALIALHAKLNELDCKGRTPLDLSSSEEVSKELTLAGGRHGAEPQGMELGAARLNGCPSPAPCP